MATVVGVLRVLLEANAEKLESEFAKATIKIEDFDKFTENAGRKLQTMVGQFSGQRIVAEAARMAAAIEKIGGISTLTERELARVSGTVAEATAKLTAMGADVPPSIAKLHAELEKLPKDLEKIPPATDASTVSFGKLVTSFVTAEAVISTVKTAFRAYTDLLSSSVDSYAAAELAQKQLTAALRAQGTATPEVIAQYKALSDQFEKTTVFSDDLVTEMQALLTQVGNVMPDQMGAALKAATDLASGLGIDLRQATMLVGKAFEGETGTLARYGIVIDEATLKAKGITAVLDAVQQRFGGQAAAELDTYGGSLKQLANNWDNLKEKLGEMIVTSPEVRDALAGINLVIQDITRTSGEATTPVGVLWDAWKQYIELGQTIAPGVSIFRDKLAELGDEARRQAEAVDTATESLNRFHASIKQNELKPLTMSTREYREAQEDLTRSAQRLIDQRLDEKLRKDQQAAEAAAKAFRELRDSFSGAAVVQSGLEMKRVLDALGGPLNVAADKLEAMHKAFVAAADGARTLKQTQLAQEFDRLAKATSPMAVFLEKWNVKLGEFSILQRGAAGDTDEFTAAILAQSLKVTDNTEALNFGAIAVTRYMDAWVPLKAAIEQTLPKIEDATSKSKRLQAAHEETSQSLRNLSQAFANLAQIAGDSDLGETLKTLGEIVGALSLAREGVDAFGKGIANIKGGNFGAGLAQMATGLAGVIAAMEQATRGTNKWKAALGGAATGALSGGGIWGAVAGFVIGWARASGNAREEARALEKQFRESFSAMAVSVQKLLPRAGVLGLSDQLQRMLGTARTIDDLKRIQDLIDEINEKFAKAEEDAADLFGQMLDAGFQIPDSFRHQFEALLPTISGANKKMLEQLLGSEVNWKKMAAAAEAFGIDVDSLGKKFQMLKFKDRAKEILDVWELLTGGMPEAQGGVLFGLKDEIQQLVIDFKRFGGAIPEQFRPLIQELIRTGQLVDENGELITDLGQIHFGEKIKTEFDKITEAIMRLIETLQGLYNMEPPAFADRTSPDPVPGGRTPTTPGEIPTLWPTPGDRFQPQSPEFARSVAGLSFNQPRIIDSLPSPDLSFTKPFPTGAVPIGQPAASVQSTSVENMLLMSVIIPKSADEHEIRDLIAARFPDDWAGDRNGLRTRAIPLLQRSVVEAIKGEG